MSLVAEVYEDQSAPCLVVGLGQTRAFIVDDYRCGRPDALECQLPKVFTTRETILAKCAFGILDKIVANPRVFALLEYSATSAIISGNL
jgi:hypothetical protein